jgi:outer membrane protein OmpA-like peptidoglycan-associated protein
MKKIWFWIAMLLLLMILCIFTKLNTIQLTHPQQTFTATSNPAYANHPALPIEFDIVQKGGEYQLSGRFKDTLQQQKLQQAFAGAKQTLHIGNTSSNQTLGAEEVIILVEAIIPHFVQTYEEGSISFHDNRLRINGIVHSYDAKRKMAQMLSRTTLPTQDESVVVLPKEPVAFRIDNNNGDFSMSGRFGDTEESEMLSRAVPGNMHLGKIDYGTRYADTQKVIPFTRQILPLFAEHYNQGHILYQDGVLRIDGLAKDQAALDLLQQTLAQAPCKVVNHTRLDPAILQKIEAQKAAEAARLKAQEEAKKAAAFEAAKAAEAAAAERARLKAEEEAKKTAELEAARAAQEAEKQRQLLAQQAKEEAEAAKQNIAKLLKVENIEFEVAKESLTPKGLATVDKLAAILKQYPHIKIEIAGHTDSDGNAEFNQKLSQARVDNVKKALISRGIDASRMIAKGYGETKPLVPNDSAENKQKNRRVEINIIGE